MLIPELQRGKAARAEVAELKENMKVEAEQTEVAVKLQALQRGNAARAEVAQMKQHAEQEHAALRMQAIHRGNQARSELSAKSKDDAQNDEAEVFPGLSAFCRSMVEMRCCLCGRCRCF